VRRLAEHHDDKTIALILSKQPRHTKTGLDPVKSLPASHGVRAYEPDETETVCSQDQDDCVVTVPKAAEPRQAITPPAIV
jgi:hypothetical protein